MVFKRPILKCGKNNFTLGERTYVMGILNVTPDSFSDGNLFVQTSKAIAQAELMIEYGADVIDIGGESTRPFSTPVSDEEEQKRVLPVIKALIKNGICNLSIDTRNSRTAQACLDEGVSWINDISAFEFDHQMVDVAKKADCVILMHARGLPENMQSGDLHYADVVGEIHKYLSRRVEFAISKGLDKNCILVDPGIGFGKKLEHNLVLIKKLNDFVGVGAGVLCGMSRKAFIGELTGITNAFERDNATMGALSWSVFSGADLVRVHNVKASVEVLKVVDVFKFGEKNNENLYKTR